MTASIQSDGFTLIILPEILGRAIELTKQVLRFNVDVNAEATEAKLFVKIDGVQYETSSIYLRKYDPEKVEQLRNELLSRFPNTEFDDIFLAIRKLTRSTAKCPNCGKVMQSNHLNRHRQSCTKERHCPVCQKVVQGDFRDHIDRCGRRTYSCNICGEPFNTGARRSAHQKKCRVADENTIPQGSKDDVNKGLFRLVNFIPNTNSPDYEGVLEDETQHIIEILSNRLDLDTGLKFYISIELNMSRLIMDETNKVTTFQTGSSMLLKTMDIEKEVKEHITLLISKIEKYIRNGSGWLVDNVKMINVMMTKYHPMGVV